jgi:IS1 family transposase
MLLGQTLTLRDRSGIFLTMNRLSAERRTAVIQALCEGNSIRATCRMTGTAKGTVLRLLERIGAACMAYHDRAVRNVAARRVQVDEIWSFCHAKARNVPERLKGKPGIGDLWTWVALDANTKLAISYYVGQRTPEAGTRFMYDLHGRLANRVQLTTDGFAGYYRAVFRAFDWGTVDYAMLVKKYGAERSDETRYSPPVCVGADKHPLMGRPDPDHISTSYVERQNLTMRMQMRRFTRLTNAFSKKAANHRAAVALHFAHYNFCRVHHTLTKAKGGIHQTPAMAAGLTDRVWKVADLVALLEPENPLTSSAA